MSCPRLSITQVFDPAKRPISFWQLSVPIAPRQPVCANTRKLSHPLSIFKTGSVLSVKVPSPLHKGDMPPPSVSTGEASASAMGSGSAQIGAAGGATAAANGNVGESPVGGSGVAAKEDETSELEKWQEAWNTEKLVSKRPPLLRRLIPGGRAETVASSISGPGTGGVNGASSSSRGKRFRIEGPRGIPAVQLKAYTCPWCICRFDHVPLRTPDELLKHIRCMHPAFKASIAPAEWPATGFMLQLELDDHFVDPLLPPCYPGVESVYVSRSRFPIYHAMLRGVAPPKRAPQSVFSRGRCTDADTWILTSGAVENGSADAEDDVETDAGAEHGGSSDASVEEDGTRARARKRPTTTSAEKLQGATPKRARTKTKSTEAKTKKVRSKERRAAVTGAVMTNTGGKTRPKAPPPPATPPKLTKEQTENQLFHSVLQTELSVKDFNEGLDSDAEHVDHDWRLDLANDELGEFTDTLPIEKVFMNLWNQFVGREYNLRADKQVFVALKLFIQRYRQTIHKFSLLLPLVRHITNLCRIGLLDADGVFELMQLVNVNENEDKNNSNNNHAANKDTNAATSAVPQASSATSVATANAKPKDTLGQGPPRFLFAEASLKRAARPRRRSYQIARLGASEPPDVAQ